MDPPPLPTLTPTTTTPTHPSSAATSAAASSIHLAYPDSLDSSPRSRVADAAWSPDEPLAPLPGAKLRLMCSYGGHIVPRPHDKSLCYVGGDTRIVVVDRHSSLSDLCARLSKTLLHGRPFTLKYQLPNEDLDSLISVATDEDLDNMIDEYDRTAAASPLKPSRLRLFLFFVKPETAASMGALLDDAKSETWFVDALNGSGLLPRGLSDSAVEDCLLSLDTVRASDSCNDLEARGNNIASGEGNKQAAPGSPLVENNSSFGSSSSSPSMSNLPPIRVRVGEEQKAASIEEQFAQISFAPPVNVNSHASNQPVVVASGDNNVSSKVPSDDERSDHGGGGGGGGGAAVGFRKPPLPLHPVQMNRGAGGAGGYGLPSPDSVTSDTSISSASSLAKPSYYQDHHQQQQLQQQQQQHYAPPREARGGPASPDTRNNNDAAAASDPVAGAQFHQSKDPPGGYLVPSPHQDQHFHQQFVPAAGAQCMHHHHHPVASPVPVSSYYQLYSQTPQPFHHPLDQQYPPVYMMPVGAQNPSPYNMPEATTTTVVATSRPNPAYPAKAASPAPPAAAPNQFPPHYVGFSHHPSQSIAVAPPGAPSYAFEYASPAPGAAHEHVFYSQHHAHAAAPMPSQYQSMTPAAAMALSEAAKQLPQDSGATQPQIRTSQPLYKETN